MNKMQSASLSKRSFWKKPPIIIAGVLLVLSCICLSIVGCQSSTPEQITPTALALSKSIVSITETTATTPFPSNTIAIPTIPNTSGLSSTSNPLTDNATSATSIIPTKPSTSIPTVTLTTAPATTVEVDFINVGQGDAELITTSEGKSILIDGGEANGMALNYLKSKGVQKIDLMVATHPHSDHIGGLVAILKSMPVTKVVTNGQPSTTTTYENFLDAIASAKAEYTEAKRGDKLVVGNLVMDVLSPTTTEGDMNNNSLVLRFTEGSTTYLFMGDAQNEAEASILTAGLPVTADILKVGHHGSRTASSSAFLTAVKPAVAVYSAGIGNSYGHPHPETIAALFAVGAQIYGTDKNGTVVVTSNGQNYQVSTNGGPRAPPATPAPAIVATARPALSALTLDITNVSSPVSRGGLGEVDAITVPGATCKITVYYKSGPSTAKGLSPQTADENGNCSWSWTVASRTTPGTWRIVVMATLNGKSITKQTTFTVQ